jgi:hypothetical protein
MALLVFCFLYKFNPASITILAKDIAGYFSVFFSVVCGFTMTSLSILYTIKDTDVAKTLKSSGAFAGLISYHIYAVYWALLALLSAFIILLLSDIRQLHDYETITNAIMYGCVSVGAGGFIAFTRIARLFYKVLKLGIKK